MEKPNPTHIIIEYPNHKAEILYRASDGVGLAQRADRMVIIGEDPNKGTSRLFFDAHHAHVFISETLPALDMAGVEMDYKLSLHAAGKIMASSPQDAKPHVEYRPGEGMITMPGDVVGIPNGIFKMQ